jgi:hypothetical protein
MMRVNIASLESPMMVPRQIDLEQDLVLDQFALRVTCSAMEPIHCFMSLQLILSLIMETSFFQIQTSLKFARNWKNLSQSCWGEIST